MYEQKDSIWHPQFFLESKPPHLLGIFGTFINPTPFVHFLDRLLALCLPAKPSTPRQPGHARGLAGGLEKGTAERSPKRRAGGEFFLEPLKNTIFIWNLGSFVQNLELKRNLQKPCIGEEIGWSGRGAKKNAPLICRAVEVVAVSNIKKNQSLQPGEDDPIWSTLLFKLVGNQQLDFFLLEFLY